MTQLQHNAIMREYSARQAASQRQLEARKEELYKVDIEFARIADEIADTALEYGMKKLSSGGNALPPLCDVMNSYKDKRIKLLKKYGYPADYLELQYVCKDCQDTGYVGQEKCHCYLSLANKLIYQDSNLKNIGDAADLKDFDLSLYDDSKKDPKTELTPRDLAEIALKKSLIFIDSFDQSFNNIFLYGDTGVGKTFLSNCIAKALIDRNKTTIYYTSFELFDALAKATFKKDGNSNSNIHDYLFDCDLLIIDDLGTELTNSFVSSQLFLIVNERILRKKSTIISTNLSVSGFVDVYSERTFSRISSCYTLLKLAGADIRIKKRIN